MTDPILLTVIGVPAPKGSLTHVGYGRMIEGRNKTQRASITEWRRAVADQARQHADGPPLNEPLKITVEFHFPPTKSDPHRHWHQTTPDLDKCCRLVGDALVDAGLIRDDRIIVWWDARKSYTLIRPPGCDITIESLADNEQNIRQVRKAQAALQRKQAKAV